MNWHDLFFYGPGTPTAVGIWLVLTPVLVIGLLVLRASLGVIGVTVAATVPTLVLHRTPDWLGVRTASLIASVATLAVLAWLGLRLVRAPSGAPPEDDDGEVGRGRRSGIWVGVGLVAALGVGLRVLVGLIDPGISDIPRASETAARALLAGHNPYRVPNPDSVIGIYQYPAASIYAHLPFVAAIPPDAKHIAARLVLWVTCAVAVGFLGWAGVRVGRPRQGLQAAWAYAVSPELVRDGGLTVANDLLLALAVAVAAWLLARRRPWWAAVLVGVAISVKPSAALMLPVVLVAAGLWVAVAAGLVAVLLQVPLLVWPSPGLDGLSAIAEPVARSQPLDRLAGSAWFPLYDALGNGSGPARVAAAGVLLVGGLVGLWAGWRLRRGMGLGVRPLSAWLSVPRALWPRAWEPGFAPPVAAVAAAMALPLVVGFLLAPVRDLNYEDWGLTALMLVVATRGERS